MKILEYVKGFISYVTAIAFTLVFALFCSGRVGWFLVLTLALAPLLSFVLLAAVSGRVSCRCEVDNTLLEKGGLCHLKVSVTNVGIFPVANMRMEFLEGVRLAQTETDSDGRAPGFASISLLGRSTREFEVEYRAGICGPEGLGIRSVRIYDFLGIFSVGVKNLAQEVCRNVSVLPDIAEFGSDNETLKRVIAASRDADDSEDSVETSSAAANGFPGYEHRDYVPGDPLKKVNWKMSAKRGKLLVRMDDEVASSTIAIVLDAMYVKNAVAQEDVVHVRERRLQAAQVAQEVLESALGLAQSLLMHNYTVNYYHLDGGVWECHEIIDDRGIVELRNSLADYEFAIGAVTEGEASARLPGWLLDGSAGVSVVFTPVQDAGLAQLLDKVAGADGTVTVWSAS